MNTITLDAYGKINLGLDVTGRLPNGYHEVKMIMQTVGLHDTLTFTVIEENSIRISANVGFIPLNEDNLIYKAIELLRKEFNIAQGLEVRLEKRLPVAAGMAGGSTDGAAALKAVNQLFKLGLSPEELAARAVKIGADVPYCVMGGTMLAEGIGEKLSVIGDCPECHILLVKPPVGVSTPMVYKGLDSLVEYAHPDIDAQIAAINSGDLGAMCRLMANVLEPVTSAEHPEIAKIREQMKELGAVNAMMSGSGPTVFGIYDDTDTARRAYAYFKQTEYAAGTFLTTPVYRRTINE